MERRVGNFLGNSDKQRIFEWREEEISNLKTEEVKFPVHLKRGGITARNQIEIRPSLHSAS